MSESYDFNALAESVYEQNFEVGWWDDIPKDNLYIKLQLILTEIAEATEGERKGLMDDHLPHRHMGEVELADALIRLLDLAGREGWHYTPGYSSDIQVIDEFPSIARLEVVVGNGIYVLDASNRCPGKCPGRRPLLQRFHLHPIVK